MIITIVLNDRGNPPSLEVHLASMCDEKLARYKNLLLEQRALVRADKRLAGTLKR